MYKASVFAVGALLLGSAAGAQVSIQSSNPAPAYTGKGDPNRIICEVEDTIGTRLGARKVCKTALEWQQLKQEQRDHVEGIQRNSNVGKQTG